MGGAACSLILVALLACSGSQRPRPAQGAVVLAIEGSVAHGPVLFGKEDVADWKRRSFRALDPRSGREATFQGPSLAALLADRVELTHEADTVVVRCRDGYDVAVPLAAIRQLKPVLADRADGKPIVEWAPTGGGGADPFLLAWPNLDSPGLDTDPRARSWWAAGVVSLKAIEWQRTYGPALRVPMGASDEARLGSDAFSVMCMQCHRVRGTGGLRGPELTEALKRSDVDRFAAAVRRHPARLEPGGHLATPSDASIRQIASFLKAVDQAGPPTAPEEPKPPEPAEKERRIGPFGPMQ